MLARVVTESNVFKEYLSLGAIKGASLNAALNTITFITGGNSGSRGANLITFELKMSSGQFEAAVRKAYLSPRTNGLFELKETIA